MSYFIRKWQVMMWKNLIVRKRHWFLTLFEIVIPILLFWGVAWIRQSNTIGQSDHNTNTTINPVLSEDQIIDSSLYHHGFYKLAYTPRTKFTQDIIREFNKTIVARLLERKALGEVVEVLTSPVK